MRIEPFTYYRSADNRRAFLVADVADPEVHFFVEGVGRVALIEWGKTREQPIYHPLPMFITLVLNGAMVPFTPTIKNL